MTVLEIPDLHAPYQHKDAVQFLRDMKRRYRPDVVVVLGDEVDCHALSRYAKDPDAFGAADELERAVKVLGQLYDMFPAALVCESNHVMRPYKRALEAGLPKAFMRNVREVLRAPKTWKWAEHHDVEGARHLHGDGFSGDKAALEAAKRHRQSCVIGHVHHVGGVLWCNGARGAMFGMSVGCLVDRLSPAMAYARAQAMWPVLGCGVIRDGVPGFVPMR